MSDYTPIDCSLHDRLEAAAVTRTTSVIRHRAGDEVVTEETRIVDIFVRNGVEYMRTTAGDEIRLDHIIEVDGTAFSAQETKGAT